MKDKILILGATGYTGELIARLAIKKFPQVTCYGRSLDENCSFPNFINGDLKELLNSSAFSEFKYIINCIGPYSMLAAPVIEACIKNSQTYIDLTGELDFVKNSMLNNSKAAKENKSTIIHSCSFESFFVDMMIEEIFPHQDQKQMNFIHSFYTFAQTKPSPGTRKTMKLHRCFPREMIKDGKWINLEQENLQINSQLSPDLEGLFAPYPEIDFINSRYQANSIASFMSISESSLGIAPTRTPDLDKTWKKLEKSNYSGPDEEDRKEQFFEVLVEAQDENENTKSIKINGKDMYLLTAHIAIEVLSELIKSNNDHYGVHSPFSVFNSTKLFKDICQNNNIQIS